MRLPFSLQLRWVSRDAKLIILARGVCTFARSSIAVLLALYLDKLGFSLVQIGAFLSAGIAGSAFFAFYDRGSLRLVLRPGEERQLKS